jgi:hypothetical protein
MKDLNILALTKAIAVAVACFWAWSLLMGLFTHDFIGPWFHYLCGFVECLCACVGIYHEEK